MIRVRTYEGVQYSPYRVRYVTSDGRRRQLTLWSPGLPWLGEEVHRALRDVDVKCGSNVLVRSVP